MAGRDNLAGKATQGDAPVSLAGDTIRQLHVSEYYEPALSLAQAFEDDELARYFVDTPDRSHWSDAEKWALHFSIMQYITYAHCMEGIVTTVGPDCGSVALWMPPNANMDSILTIFRSGLWRLFYKLSRIGRRRFFWEFFPLLHDTKAAVLGPRDSTSYYLVYIGTRPSARGKGYARRLIEDMNLRADDDGRACYLESTATKNLALYRRCGYEVERRIVVGQEGVGGVPLDIMVREPRSTTTAGARMSGHPAQISSSDQHASARVKQLSSDANTTDSACNGVSMFAADGNASNGHIGATEDNTSQVGRVLGYQL